jgi:hypothetical protein
MNKFDLDGRYRRDLEYERVDLLLGIQVDDPRGEGDAQRLEDPDRSIGNVSFSLFLKCKLFYLRNASPSWKQQRRSWLSSFFVVPCTLHP